MHTRVYVSVCVLFATLRTLSIYLLFPVRYGKKCFVSIVGKSFDSVMQPMSTFYLFML